MRKAHWLSILILTAAAGRCVAADHGKASDEGVRRDGIEQTAATERFKPTYACAWKENRAAKQQTLIYLFDRKAPADQWTDAENRESAIVVWMIDNKASVVSWTLDDQGKPDGVQSSPADASCCTAGNSVMNDVASLVADIKSDAKEQTHRHAFAGQPGLRRQLV